MQDSEQVPPRAPGQVRAGHSLEAEGSTSVVGPTWGPVLGLLLAVGALLVLLSAAAPLALGAGPVDRTSPVRVFLDVSGERNLPTWWNSGLLMLAGALSAGVGSLRHRCRVDGRFGWLAWWGLALLLGLMALDEFAGLHERLDGLWRLVVGENPLPAFGWLMLGIPLGLGVVIFLWLCVRVLPAPATHRYVLGIAVFLLGALAVESVVVVAGVPLDSWAYVASYHVEELLEFSGSALLVVAPLSAARLAPLRWSPDRDGAVGMEVLWHGGRDRTRRGAPGMR